jgi:hypothetical protein
MSYCLHHCHGSAATIGRTMDLCGLTLAARPDAFVNAQEPQ